MSAQILDPAGNGNGGQAQRNASSSAPAPAAWPTALTRSFQAFNEQIGRRHQRHHRIQAGAEARFASEQERLPGLLPDGTARDRFAGRNLYNKVKVGGRAEIVAETLVGGKVVDRLLYVDPATKKHCRGINDIPFYQRQQRFVLKECGTIDPEASTNTSTTAVMRRRRRRSCK
jgi:hypothetical protein